ncbi:DUF6114 domain-containing protein [Dictyobacter aurantiacus]|uniref:Uncharacterized protein n=1 Tax=Dictyobacter aurantiacus TaxID=1936993 RepID=A0A401ZSL4_9CHLR|nr:DUF6114 domain-containing protein [Dictyobacter aurantiacus]GCE09802.1 hypothetical protein KDAU_71310 [Dictyobacter aurantiacus]
MANQDDSTIVDVQGRDARAEKATANTSTSRGRLQKTMLERLTVPHVQTQPQLQKVTVPRREAGQKDDWHQWSRFRLWRKTRPFTGGILVVLAGVLVLWGPVALLPFALLPGSNIWAGLLVGGLLVTMGIIQLLVPSNALLAGAIAVVLSLVSLLVAAGGFGIGMLLGIIGGAMGIAWQPVTRVQTRPRSLYKFPSSLKFPFLRSR